MTKPRRVEFFYSLTCPNCKVLEKMLEDVLPLYSPIEFRKVLVSSPAGYFRSLKLGIHSVPTLLIDGNVVLRSVPTREELVQKLNKFFSKSEIL